MIKTISVAEPHANRKIRNIKFISSLYRNIIKIIKIKIYERQK